MNITNFREAYTMLCLSLKNKAIEKGITYQKIADETGMSQPNVSKLLNGIYVTSVENFLKLTKAIDEDFYNRVVRMFKNK